MRGLRRTASSRQARDSLVKDPRFQLTALTTFSDSDRPPGRWASFRLTSVGLPLRGLVRPVPRVFSIGRIYRIRLASQSSSSPGELMRLCQTWFGALHRPTDLHTHIEFSPLPANRSGCRFGWV